MRTMAWRRPSRSDAEPDRVADQYADTMLATQPKLRLALVAANRGADTLAVAGWTGPANYTTDTARPARYCVAGKTDSAYASSAPGTPPSG